MLSQTESTKPSRSEIVDAFSGRVNDTFNRDKNFADKCQCYGEDGGRVDLINVEIAYSEADQAGMGFVFHQKMSDIPVLKCQQCQLSFSYK